MNSVRNLCFFNIGVPTFGNLRIDAYLQLPEAYRSSSRPSSAPDAKAFTLCSFQLELPVLWFSRFLHGDSQFASFGCLSCEKTSYHLSDFVFITHYLILERPIFYNCFSLICSFAFIRFSMNVFGVPQGTLGWHKWTRTTDLALIRRAL